MKQISFSDLAYEQKKKTRNKRFLGEMDAVPPWDLLLAPILAHNPKLGNGRRRMAGASPDQLRSMTLFST